MAGFATLFLTSFKVMVTLMIQYGIGVAIAYKGFIRESDMPAFASVMNVLLVPLLSFTSLGRGLTFDCFVTDGWILALIGLVSLYEFALIAFPLRWLAQPPSSFRRLFVVLVSFPNVVAIPLSMTQTMCELGTFDAEYASREECIVRSRAFVFMYVSFSSFNIWVVIFNYVRSDPSEQQHFEGPAKVQQPAATAAVDLRVDTASHTDGAVPARTDSDTPMPTAAAPSPAAQAARGSSSAQSAGRLRLAGRAVCSVVARPPVLGIVGGLVVGLVESLQWALYADGAPLQVVGLALESLAGATVPIVNLMLAFSLGHKLRTITSWRALLDGDDSGLTPRSLLLATLGRMLIVPLVHGALLFAVLDYLPSGRLFRMLLFIEVAPPTASLLVLLAHVNKKPRIAQLAALAFVPQYLVGIVSLTLVVAFALYVTQM